MAEIPLPKAYPTIEFDEEKWRGEMNSANTIIRTKLEELARQILDIELALLTMVFGFCLLAFVVQ